MNEKDIAGQPPATANATPAKTSERVGTSDAGRPALQTYLRRTIVLGLLYALPACLVVTSLTLGAGSANPDLWWHLRTGSWIVQHHTVPETDPFSAFGMDKPWLAYAWLFDLVIYGFYRWLGLIGPAVCVMLLAAALGIVLYQALHRRMRRFAAPIALTSVGLVVLMRFYSAMPLLVSILLFAVEANILFADLVDEPEQSSPRRLWALPAIFMLWANVHVAFVYGMAVLVIAALTQNVGLARGPRGLQIVSASSERRHKLWVVTAASFIATFINPYSWRIYRVILGLARDRAPFAFVSELRAPDFRTPLDYILVLTVLSAAFVIGRVRFRGNLFAGLLLVGTTIVSLRAAHDEWVALITALLIIAVGCRQIVAPAVSVRGRQRILAGLFAILFVFAWAKRRNLSNAHLEADAAAYFPVKAAEFVSQHGLRGPLFNDFNWGGYLIWRLPNLPVSMDGRTNVYGGPRTARSIRTWNCMPGWKDDPDLNAANLVIGPTAMPLSYALQDEPTYELAYGYAIAVVFVKKAP